MAATMACVEAVRSAGAPARGIGPDNSEKTKKTSRCWAWRGGMARPYCEGVCTVLQHYYYYYTPFMSCSIVTEALEAYLDGWSRGYGQAGVIYGLRTSPMHASYHRL